MFANVGLGTEQLNEAATERCTCEEAKELAGAAETCGEGSQENRKNLC